MRITGFLGRVRATEEAPRRRTSPAQDRPVLIEYQDRISVATWILILGLATTLLLDLETTTLIFNAFGSPIGIPLGQTTLAVAFMAILAAAGAESVVTVHPYFAIENRSRWSSWPFWALPMAISMIAVLLLPSAPNRMFQIIVVGSGGGLVALAFFCLYATVEAGLPGFRRSRLLLDALGYGAALLLFLFVYQTRTRSLFSGTLIAATAFLLAVELLRSSVGRATLTFGYGAIVGLVLGQVTWALNYWSLGNLTGGLFLLLIFYLLTGIAKQGVKGRISRRVVIEYAIFTAIAVALIFVVGPRFG